MSPEERKERSAQLGAALEAYLDGQGFDGMLGDWMVVGAVVRVDEDNDPDATYFVGFSGGSMLQHTALGLLAKGEDVLVNGGPDDDD